MLTDSRVEMQDLLAHSQPETQAAMPQLVNQEPTSQAVGYVYSPPDLQL